MIQAKPSLVRVSLRTLLVLMMLLCIALATTVSASPRVELAMKWVSAIAPAVAILLAAATSGSRRAFWMGFAAFGIWGYPLMFTRAETAMFLTVQFNGAFRDYATDCITELHPDEVDAEATRQLMRRAQRTKAETVEQVKARVPASYWSDRLADGREYVADVARRIAWYNLHLAIALIGGVVTANPFARRDRHAVTT